MSLYRRVDTHFVCCVLSLMACVATASDSAYKCTDQSGRITFSDVGCPASTAKQSVISTDPATRGAGGNEIRLLRNIQAIRDYGSSPRRAVAERPPERSGSPNNCPTERDVANLETKASSITLDKRSKDFLLAEIRRARACSREGGNYTDEDWARINNGIAGQSRNNRADRELSRRAAESVHSIAASSQEQARMQADADREAIVEAARIRAEEERRNRVITRCEDSTCWDVKGRPYIRSGEIAIPAW